MMPIIIKTIINIDKNHKKNMRKKKNEMKLNINVMK